MSDSKPRYLTLLEQIDAFLAENPPPPAEGPTLKDRMVAWMKARAPVLEDGERRCAFCLVSIAGEHHSAQYCRACRDPETRRHVLAVVNSIEAQKGAPGDNNVQPTRNP